MGHDHTISFGFTTGVDWLRLVVVSGILFVTAFTLVRPAIDAPSRPTKLAVTVTAGCVGLLLLLLSDRMDIPQQAVVAALAVSAVPVAVTRHPEGPAPAPVTVAAVRAAPALVMAAATGTGIELAMAVVDRAASAQHVDTGLLVGVTGLSWLVLCQPVRRLPAFATHVLAWVLGNLVLSGATVLAVTGIPG